MMDVLLVEDDDVLGDAVHVAMSQEGYAVTWVRDGVAAERELKERRFDLILLDLNLPGRAGLDVLRAARAGGDPTPVLVLTARDTVGDRVRGLDAGADDYLVKPFDLGELHARVRALLRRAGGAHVKLIKHGELTLDVAAHLAFWRGETVELLPREFLVLRLLVENAGKVLSRERLENVLYSGDGGVGSNAVEVHVHRLRRKLGADFIRTLRGVGYTVPKQA